jgi:hypothetical protein
MRGYDSGTQTQYDIAFSQFKMMPLNLPDIFSNVAGFNAWHV